MLDNTVHKSIYILYFKGKKADSKLQQKHPLREIWQDVTSIAHLDACFLFDLACQTMIDKHI